MTIEECYQEIGGDYADVSSRLPSAKLINKFVAKFLEDPSFDQLCEQMKNGDRAEAFRAAHTLKGVCANLGFGHLLTSSGELTEVLREENEQIPEAAFSLLEDVRAAYNQTASAIRVYLEGMA